LTAARLVAIGAPLAADEEAAVTAALASAGVPLEARMVVDEDEAALERALAARGLLTVILTGAGVSAADVARRTVARLTGARLVLHDRMLAALEEAHRRRDRPLPRREERLALLPQGAAVWPGDGEMAWSLETPDATYVVLGRPGPPVLAELTAMARRGGAGRAAVAVRTLRTAGVALAAVEERLTPWLAGEASDVTVAVVAVDGEVWARLRARGATLEAAAATLAAAEADVRARLGEDCYGRDDETLERVVGRRLVRRRLTLAVAESCTGGLVGHRLTSVPGSSTFFERGVIVYSNRAKQDLLGVPEEVLRTHGAVSAPCAEAMVRGVCARAGTPCGLSITGIAGPDGGSAAKPVGTVFIGVAVPDGVETRRFLFTGGRAAVKALSAQMALDMLRRRLGGE
jgi:nicotinamide-nucleotide amidase